MSTRRTFIASALMVAVFPTMARGVIQAPAGCEIPEEVGVVPVVLDGYRVRPVIDPRCLPEDEGEEDEEVIEVSAIDLRGL